MMTMPAMASIGARSAEGQSRDRRHTETEETLHNTNLHEVNLGRVQPPWRLSHIHQVGGTILWMPVAGCAN